MALHGDGADFISSPDGSFLSVTGRVDDLRALAARLGAGDLDGRALLARAWERWGVAALDHVIGDIALAHVGPDGAITLARSFLSACPLFYRDRGFGLDWASAPQALCQPGDSPDLAYLARFVAGMPSNGEGVTAFAQIRAVPHGSALRWRPGEAPREVWRWRPTRTAGPRDLGPAGEQMRHLLDEAVRDRTADLHGPIAAQLSAGRDSSAVCASLAVVRPEHELIAITSAPPLDYRGEGWGARLYDESAIAGRTAAAIGRFRHEIVRPDGASDLAELTRLHGFLHRPSPNAALLGWTAASFRQAHSCGASAMLIGSRGNYTISLGTHFFLADLLAEGGMARALAGAFAGARFSPGGWRSALHAMLGPHVPASLYRRLLARKGLWSDDLLSAGLLRPHWRALAEASAAEELGDPRPARSEFALMADLMGRMDPAELALQPAYGVEARDPCADRRLVEFVYSLPPQLLSPSREAQRPVYAAAFGDRLPDEVVNGRNRGLQAADWWHRFPADLVTRRWEELLGVPVVGELFDPAAVRAELSAWPAAADQSLATTARFRDRLIGGLAVADWLAVHFP